MKLTFEKMFNLMKKRKITADELCHKAGISHALISKMKKDTEIYKSAHEYSMNTLAQIAEHPAGRGVADDVGVQRRMGGEPGGQEEPDHRVAGVGDAREKIGVTNKIKFTDKHAALRTALGDPGCGEH